MADFDAAMARVNRYMDADNRRLALMQRVVTTSLADDVPAALEAVCDELMAIFDELPSDELFLKRADVGLSIADCCEWVGRAHNALGHFEEALAAVEQAAKLFRSLERPDRLERLEELTAQLRLVLGQDVNAEIERLQRKLAATPAGSSERANVLLTLAELHARLEDDAGAASWLEQAEPIVGAMVGANDFPARLAAAMQALKAGQMEALRTIDELNVGNNLQRRFFLAGARIYRRSDAPRAQAYSERARALGEISGELQAILKQIFQASDEIKAKLEP